VSSVVNCNNINGQPCTHTIFQGVVVGYTLEAAKEISFGGTIIPAGSSSKLQLDLMLVIFTEILLVYFYEGKTVDDASLKKSIIESVGTEWSAKSYVTIPLF
jgi:hypothetical protein